jgi:hypothetical protein
MPEPPSFNAADLADAEHVMLEDSTSEHISLGDEYEERRSRTGKIAQVLEVTDRLRGRQTGLSIYDEGFLKIVEKRRGKTVRRHRLDLRFLDPVPTIKRYYPRRLVKTAYVLAGLTVIAGLLAYFGVMHRFSIPAAAVASAALLVSLIWFVYLSHEKITFHTLHGRAKALQLGAGLGYIRRFHKLVPELVRAIEEAADDIGEDTIVYLRSEMREHYRLRGDGVLSNDECSDSTGRILAQFDDPL